MEKIKNRRGSDKTEYEPWRKYRTGAEITKFLLRLKLVLIGKIKNRNNKIVVKIKLVLIMEKI